MVIKNLVLSGGGIKGIAHCGAMGALDLTNVHDVLGVSIGALIGMMFCVGYTPKEMYNVILETDFSSLFEPRLLELVETYGMDSGKLLMKWVNKLLLNKGFENPTFETLYKKTGKNLRILTTNITTAKYEIFDKDSSPDAKVMDTLRMSISIPLLFGYKKYKGNVYADGAITNTCPIQEYKDVLDVSFGIKLEGPLVQSVDSFKDYLNNIFICIDKRIALTDEEKKSTLVINIDVSLLDFGICKKTKRKIMDYGKQVASEFFTAALA